MAGALEAAVQYRALESASTAASLAALMRVAMASEALQRCPFLSKREGSALAKEVSHSAAAQQAAGEVLERP